MRPIQDDLESIRLEEKLIAFAKAAQKLVDAKEAKVKFSDHDYVQLFAPQIIEAAQKRIERITLGYKDEEGYSYYSPRIPNKRSHQLQTLIRDLQFEKVQLEELEIHFQCWSDDFILQDIPYASIFNSNDTQFRDHLADFSDSAKYLNL